MSSHFDSVCTFNTLFGVYLPKSPQHNILTEDPKTVENALKLIREECREFHEAFVANDKVEQLDACIDICYVTLGMIARFGETFGSSDRDDTYYLKDTDYDALIAVTLREIDRRVTDKNYHETIELLLDMYYNAMGVGSILLKPYAIKHNITLRQAFDEAFLAVHENNMTKFCNSEDEAIRTIKERYGNDPEYKTPNYKLAPDGLRYIVYNEQPSKVLKSISWSKMSLDHFII